MLEFSDRAVTTFNNRAIDDFDVRACEFLAENFPDLLVTRGRHGLHRFVVAGQNRSSLLGSRSEQDILNFLVIQAIFGDNFDIDPRFAHATMALEDRSLAFDIRLDEVFKQLSSSGSLSQ